MEYFKIGFSKEAIEYMRQCVIETFHGDTEDLKTAEIVDRFVEECFPEEMGTVSSTEVIQ